MSNLYEKFDMPPHSEAEDDPYFYSSECQKFVQFCF